MKRFTSLIISLIVLFNSIIVSYALESTESAGYFEISDDNTYLYLENFTDLSIVEDYPFLEEVYLDNCEINVPDCFADSDITEFVFESCIFSVEILELPIEVENITVNDCSAESLKVFKNLNLFELSLENMYMDNLNNLPDSIKTNSLQISYSSLSSLDGIENFAELNTLDIDNVLIESVEELSALDKLRHLSLTITAVSDLEPIKDLNLKTLTVESSFNLKNIDVITEMDSLTEIYIDNCEMALTKESVDYLASEKGLIELQDSLKIKNQIEKIADDIIPENASDDEIIETVVDYVLRHVEYDERVESDGNLLLEYNNNALKYALEGIGCCYNYAALTSALLTCADIETYTVMNDNHIWNLVNKNREFYWLDVTYMIGVEDFKDNENYMADYDDEEFLLYHDYSSIPSTLYNKINGIAVNDASYPETDISDDNKSDNTIIIVVLSAFLITVIVCIVFIKIKNKKILTIR